MRDQPELLLKMRRRKQNRNVKAISTNAGTGSIDEGTASSVSTFLLLFDCELVEFLTCASVFEL